MNVRIELHFLPSIAYFRALKPATVIELEACEHYQKGSYRNRAYVIGANGVQRLSMPLAKGKNQQMAIQAVALKDTRQWLRQHWQTIRSAYGSAPFFPYYGETLEQIFQEDHQQLWTLNLRLLQTIFRWLQWDKTIELTSKYETAVTGNVFDLRQTITPKTTPVQTSSPGDYAVYPQLFTERHGFVANLSVLDLLFCQGPAANAYLG